MQHEIAQRQQTQDQTIWEQSQKLMQQQELGLKKEYQHIQKTEQYFV